MALGTAANSAAQVPLAESGASAVARVARPDGRVIRRLERFQRLARQQAWDEAADLAIELLAGKADGWIAIDDRRFEGLRLAIHRQIAGLPADGLAAYRRQADPLAAAWLERGVEQRDDRLLRRLVDEAFCSSSGDDALWALGDLHLERGDCQAARACWQRLHPETAPPGAAACPDASIDLSSVLARLALASIREGDLERARGEVAVLAQRFPDARGRLGGRDVNYATWLAELIDQAGQWGESHADIDWPQWRGGADRTNASPAAMEKGAPFEQAWSRSIAESPGLTESDHALTILPTVAEGIVAWLDGAGISAVRLVDGKPTNAQGPALLAVAAQGEVRDATAITLDAERAFAVVPAPAQGRSAKSTTRLVGLDLRRDGALLFQEAPDPETDYFGPPLVEGDHVIVCTFRSGQGGEASIVCYDLWTQAIRWRRALASVYSTSGGPETRDVEMALSAGAGVCYVTTNLGFLAALRIDDGDPLWLATYPRRATNVELESLVAPHWRASPCAAWRSLLIAAPRDAAELAAFDATTGAVKWTRPLEPGDRLMAVDKQGILMAGAGLTNLDLATGHENGSWSGDRHDGAGEGMVAGELVFWPTDHEIELLDRQTGLPVGEPLSLPAGGGAHLAVATAGDWQYLIAAGPSHVTAYRRIDSTPNHGHEPSPAE